LVKLGQLLTTLDEKALIGCVNTFQFLTTSFKGYFCANRLGGDKKMLRQWIGFLMEKLVF